MSNRLTKIYTRTGDKGHTGLSGGERVAKDSALIQALGDVDELNSLLGLIACKLDGELVSVIKKLQNDLFNVGAELSCSKKFIHQEDVNYLEQQLDSLNNELPPLKEFILPGGGEAACLCHLARSVCRRAERSLVAACHDYVIDNELMAYTNRLSDLLFVTARFIGKRINEKEFYWGKDNE